MSKQPTKSKAVKASKTSSTKAKTVSAKATKTKKSQEVQSATPSSPKSRFSMAYLRKFNILASIFLAIEGIVVLVLSKQVTWPVTTNYLTVDELATKSNGSPVLVTATKPLFDLNLGYIVAAFLLLSSLALAIVATVYRKRYEADLAKGINRARWFEYSVTASLMMVGIGLLSGITDLSSLIMIFALIAVMNLCGLVMEVVNQGRKQPNWLSYIVGCIAGIIPWVVFVIYVWGATVYGGGDVPSFVYWIYLSIFLFFNCFAIVMYKQYKGKGKWADYLYGERAYIILSVVAKSALAWQVFAGTLRP